eukprot:9888000-Alexandrium_andersonii.AAC.1
MRRSTSSVPCATEGAACCCTEEEAPAPPEGTRVGAGAPVEQARIQASGKEPGTSSQMRR